MKRSIFFGLISLLLCAEIIALLFFIFSKKDSVDTIKINGVVKAVENNWDSFDGEINNTDLDYVVIDLEGKVLYKTASGLSENINSAIRHEDLILDIKSGKDIVGKIIFNNNYQKYNTDKQKIIFVIVIGIVIQMIICVIYYIYIFYTVIRPFKDLDSFARRIAGGNLDIPLTMDRRNLFGAFTESFDIMRYEIKKARIAEAKANSDKKELVAKLSHDIKTPIASIKAASEVGMALSVDEKNKRNYIQIVQKSDQINTLITNLFSASLEELNELTVEPAEIKSIEIGRMLENADYFHKSNIPEIPECLICADKLRLQQVFDNIFANSYKYAGTEIYVTANIKENYLVISIEDSGGGVKESELPFLKEKFKRGSNTKDIEGAGLGLYISDYCMKKMNGRLEIENGEKGLKAYVYLSFETNSKI